jgi:hypothetical protein
MKSYFSAKKLMKLKVILLSEIKPSQNDKYPMFSLICGISAYNIIIASYVIIMETYWGTKQRDKGEKKPDAAGSHL